MQDPPHSAPTLQLDNPLYHVYEGALERRQKRAGSISANMTKSQSTGELAKHNQDNGTPELFSIYYTFIVQTFSLILTCVEMYILSRIPAVNIKLDTFFC